MKYLRLLLLFISIHLLAVQTYSQTVNFSVTINASMTPISPYIYGANPAFTAGENLGARRIGGNRLTGYNWENNASNAGTDYLNSSDNYLASGIPDPGTPGIVTTTFLNEALSVGAYPLVTLQMAGYVAKDKNGTVSLAETAPSSRWDKVQFVKGSAFSLSPDITDTSVYMDEYVNYLVEAYGLANTETGVKGYELDNEPALWQSTHPRIHPDTTKCREVVQKGIALSSAVKYVDSTAEIFGPVLYGFAAYTTFQGASDWSTVSKGKNYDWFIDYYLDEMRKAELPYGKRLLDVLDLHWYPEAYGDSRISDANANSAKDKAARLQASRTLWDPNYGYSASNPAVGENSWISQSFHQYLPLIPKLMASINKYYPGTKLAFTEFTYGGENDITGGIATADVLGIFGKYGVYFATFWPGNSNTSYVQAAYRMFRNYDGAKSTFGDASTPARTSDSVNTSIYCSMKTGTNEIHMIVINKNLNSTKTATFTIQHNKSVLSGNVWVLDNSGASIRNAGSIASIQNNTFSYTLPAGSVCHFVLQTSLNVNVDQANSNSPSLFKLDAYPNPFNLSCKIEYALPDNSGSYSMEIIDVMGRVLKSYRQLSRNGFIMWDGTNENNQVVASGVYCVIVHGNSQRPLSKRIVLMK
jgi:mannan endo-1,4-beta-mannosidase